MIHELLLALSGHPSPFLNPEAGKDSHLVENLSPPEIALLERLAQDLGGKYTKIRDGATKIISSHPSNVCRAVATSITSVHLVRFQDAIVQVEQDILQQRPNMVGAYNVVPLSGVVHAFDGWKEKLDWLATLVVYMQTGSSLPRRGQKPNPCNGKEIIERLRQSMQTGYPDIEDLSLQLSKVAELSWLRQASLWILHGKLPSTKGDFFVNRDVITLKADEPEPYVLEPNLIPSFVTQSTAASMLFIGKILNNISDMVSDVRGLSFETAPSTNEFLPRHLARLSTLTFPLNSSDFAGAISDIRTSISENALQKLLPMPKILEVLRILRQFFLLDRGEFAVALIISAEDRLVTKQTMSADKQLSKGASSLDRLTIKEREVSATLARAWTSIATSHGIDEDEADDDLELARGLLKLSIGSLEAPSAKQDPMQNSPRVEKLATFDDILLPTPTNLTMVIQHPLELCFTPSSITLYSHIHAYLLSIRRAHHQLSKLYLLSALRRTRSSTPSSAHPSVAKAMRAVWATVSSAIFFLAELGEFLQGTVIKQSLDRFHEWLEPSISRPGSRPSTAHSSSVIVDCHGKSMFRDPDAFVEAHNSFLHALVQGLLLDFEPFTKELRAFMSTIDHLSALVQRMESTINVNTHEEQAVLHDLRASQRGIAQSLRILVATLHGVDKDGAQGNGTPLETYTSNEGAFVPSQNRGVDQLLLKLGHIEEER